MTSKKNGVNLTMEFGGVTPISHATHVSNTGRAVVQDHLNYDENPTQISQGSAGSRPIVATKNPLETIVESQNSSAYSPSKIMIKNGKSNANSCVKEQEEEAEESSGILIHAQ